MRGNQAGMLGSWRKVACAGWTSLLLHTPTPQFPRLIAGGWSIALCQQGWGSSDRRYLLGRHHCYKAQVSKLRFACKSVGIAMEFGEFITGL